MLGKFLATILSSLKQVVFTACLFVASLSYAQPQLVADSGLLTELGKQKIEEISTELYNKTGVSIVLYVKKSLDKQNILDYEDNISKTLTEPFVLIVFTEIEQKVDMIVKPEALAKIVDKNFVLNERMIPILGAVSDKNAPDSRYSAALLNGVGEVADRIAESKNIVLDSSIGSQNIQTMNVIRVIFYGIIIGSIGIFVYRRYFT